MLLELLRYYCNNCTWYTHANVVTFKQVSFATTLGRWQANYYTCTLQHKLEYMLNSYNVWLLIFTSKLLAYVI